MIYLTDKVCIDVDGTKCVADFSIWPIVSQKGMDDKDGVLGLSPRIGTSLTDALKGQGLISESVVAIYWGDEKNDNDVGYIMFGGYDKSFMTEGDKFTGLGMFWYPTVNDTMWELTTNDVQYSSTSVKNRDTARTAILDSGYRYVSLPK